MTVTSVRTIRGFLRFGQRHKYVITGNTSYPGTHYTMYFVDKTIESVLRSQRFVRTNRWYVLSRVRTNRV